MTVNPNSVVQHVIQNKNGMLKHVNMNVKIIISVKKIIAGILAHVFLRMVSISKVLSTLEWLSVIKLYLLWTLCQLKKTITVATNVTSSPSINYHSKKVGGCYILHTIFLAIILLLVITIICYHHAKQEGIV